MSLPKNIPQDLSDLFQQMTTDFFRHTPRGISLAFACGAR